MQSTYKRLGNYIELVDERNVMLNNYTLLGLSITKQFIPSVANTVGTDMKNYKIIRKNQFACSTMQVRRDGKMPVALLQDLEEAIISQAYPVFQIIDESILLPEYLMMWFTREEFDRHACFLAVGGVRGSIEWDDFCDMTFPMPTIEEQRAIVAEYNIVSNRIKLNQSINQKLEETAQALYKHWFVDFEFPDENGKLKEYIETNPKLDLKKGITSTYIEMANLSETSMSIEGSKVRAYKGGARFQNYDTLLARITPCLENGKTAFVDILNESEIAGGSTEFIVMRAKENVSPYWVYCLAKDEEFRSYAISSMIGSSGRQRVHEKYLEDFELPRINNKQMEKFDEFCKPVFETIRLKSEANRKLLDLQTLLLSKMARVGEDVVEK